MTCLSALAAAGCTANEPPTVASSRHALGGVEGTLEYALDAPWRIEPHTTSTGAIEYGAIPIQISIHDIDIVGSDTGDGSDSDVLTPTHVCGVTVFEQVGTSRVERRFGLHELEEMERSYRWLGPADTGRQAPPPPGMTTGKAIDFHTTCRPEGLPGRCDGMSLLEGSSEWHATLWYWPNQTSPGGDVVLEAVALVADDDGSCAAPRITMSNYVSVHLAEAPLPRFSDGWLYGDLHYHSQGTDNEGETGYNYRGVIRAMGALGLDFAFATEHASSSWQVLDLDVDLIGGSVTDPDWLDPDVTRGLRDMNGPRFRFLLDQLNRPDGVNALTALTGAPTRAPQGWLTHRAYPQIFLGGELDAIPEIAASDFPTLRHGNGERYSVPSLWACDELDNPECVLSDTVFPGEGTESTATGILVKDLQGKGELFFGREHLVYLPDSGADADAFVPSYTSKYGGATRRLADDHDGKLALLPDIERHGSAFLAHHWNNSTPDHLGPDGPPWSEMMLEKAWRSPAILGLQFWNEPERLKTEIEPCEDDDNERQRACEQGYRFRGSWVDHAANVNDDNPRHGFLNGIFRLRPRAGAGNAAYMPSPVWEEAVFDTEKKLHHGAASWDRMLLMGLDTEKTGTLPWLATGEPRRFFVAGGSDAHGDLNYRRAGYMRGTTSISDAAIGKARNLVFVGAPTLPAGSNTPVTSGGVRHSQEQVTSALKAGHFSVTSGPALRIVVDRNRSGTIDAGDPMMGDVHWMQGDTSLPLLVDWQTTTEFGDIEDIQIYVGAASGDGTQSRVYAPAGHGPRARDRSGVEHVPTDGPDDVYWPVAGLSSGPMPGQATRQGLPPNTTAGTWATTLALASFPTDDAGTTPTRLYVRAFARTRQKSPALCAANDDFAWRTGQCIHEYALTNPVWAIQDLGWQAAYKDAWTGFGDSGPWNAGDVNGDHRLDLIHLMWTAPGSLRAHTLLRNADGTWTQRWSDVWPGFGDSDVRKWRVADVTGDGNVDLVHVAWSASVGIRVHTLIADGNGGWNRIYRDAWPGFGLSDVENWRVADVSGDGKVDLVHLAWSVSSGIRVHTLVSNGDGTWTARYRDAWPGFGDSNVARWRTADVDGNGRADLVHVMKTAQGIRVHALRSNDDGSWSMAVHDPWPGFGATDVDTWRVSDVDGDSRTDLVHVMWTAPGNLRVHTLLAKEGGGWEPKYQDVWSGFGASDVASWRVADADGDGRNDLVHVMWSAPGNLRVHTLLSQGNGTWRATYRDVWQGFGDSDVSKWRVTDIDGDHAADLFHVAWSAPGNLRVHTLRSLSW